MTQPRCTSVGLLTTVVTGWLSTGYAEPLTEYSIGNPSSEEQYIVERINRTRMDPKGEAHSLRHSSDPSLTGAFVTLERRFEHV